ncbi:hypothetical protein FACS1894208_02410 [Clostridia bacterium]|nr:hypothetical protein FACS1894208_02410 [Clostridia bacterium]
MEKHFTPAQAAELLGISVQTIRAWDKGGKIKVIRTPGNQRRVPESEVVRLSESMHMQGDSRDSLESIDVMQVENKNGMLNVEIPQDIEENDKLEYRCLQLASSLFSTFKSYWGYSIQKTLEVFQQNGIYTFIRDNYEFYHTVGKIYIVEDVCECLELPEGSWTK